MSRRIAALFKNKRLWLVGVSFGLLVVFVLLPVFKNSPAIEPAFASEVKLHYAPE